MEPFVIWLLLVFAFAVGWALVPRRAVTFEERMSKLREQSYARWYAARARAPLYDCTPTKPIDLPYAPHRAVNLLPYAVGER